MSKQTIKTAAVRHHHQQAAPESLLSIAAVMDRTRLGHAAIEARIAKGTFPASRSLGSEAVGWAESDIDLWINSHTPPQSKDLATYRADDDGRAA
jgi:predicted DNA-binding transcriptional regulator AlpA